MAEIAKESPVGLSWTGHPFIDAGVAGLTVFAKKRDPTEVTATDLERFAEWAADAYFTKEARNRLTVTYTPNALSLNYSFAENKNRAVLRDVLNSYMSTSSSLEERCTFFDLPANRTVDRRFSPLLSGRGVANFYPDGRSGLPTSGLAITVLAALPIAAPFVSSQAKPSSGPLIVSSDNSDLLLRIVREWQLKIRERIQLSAISGDKLSTIWSNPRTRLVETLIDVISREDIKHFTHSSVTAYHVDNRGKGSYIAIYALSSPILRFLSLAKRQRYRDAWSRITHDHWRKAQKEEHDPIFGTRNVVYETLFELPTEAPRFIRRFFRKPVFDYLRLVQPSRQTKSHKQKSSSQLQRLSTLMQPLTPLWPLVEIFLEVIVAMEKQRIKAIRTLGDRLADEVATAENGKRLFREIYVTRTPFRVRQLLIRLSQQRLKKGKTPSVGYDEYFTIFEENEELAQVDSRLAWDLTLIRFLEKLYESKWIPNNEDALEELDDTEMENI